MILYGWLQRSDKEWNVRDYKHKRVKAVTIKEIAEEAGVSSAAVSRYFNGGSLGAEKQQRIREVVERNHYVPNAMAQTMRTGKSGQIGVIVPQIHSDSLSQIMTGIAGELEQNDYTLILGCTDGKWEKEVQYIETMQRNKMEGIILMGTVMTPYLNHAIKSCQIPLVVTGQCFDGVPSVFYDDRNAMRELAALMLKKRKNIAYIGVTEEDVAVGKLRKQGVCQAFEDAGRKTEQLMTDVSDFSVEGGYMAMERLLKKNPHIDGVLCATDLIAHGAMRAIREAGKRIPKDISIAGIGNSWADMVSEPQLTTVQLYFERCGQTAVALLTDMIKSGSTDHPISHIMLGYSVIERGSI